MQQRGGQQHDRGRCRVSAILRPIVPILLILVFGLSEGRAAGDTGAPESEMFDFGRFDESGTEKWKEVKTGLPAYPEDRNFVPVPMQPADTVKAHLDRKSLSRAADGVGRYTLVLESSSGARNVFFEGIRCESREYKTYAIGVDGAFEPIKKPAWRPIPYFERNAFRYTLYKHYVCDDGGSVARTPRELIQSLQYDR